MVIIRRMTCDMTGWNAPISLSAKETSELEMRDSNIPGLMFRGCHDLHVLTAHSGAPNLNDGEMHQFMILYGNVPSVNLNLAGKSAMFRFSNIYGGFLKWMYPQIIQVIRPNFKVLKPMVTWRSDILRNHVFHCVPMADSSNHGQRADFWARKAGADHPEVEVSQHFTRCHKYLGHL